MLVWILGRFDRSALSGHLPNGKGAVCDSFLTFGHAAWFAYSLKLPLLYQPFPYSDQLQLDRDPTLLSLAPQCNETITLDSVSDYLQFYQRLNTEGTIDNALIVVPFYPESPYLFEGQLRKPQFSQVNWKDPQFKAQMRRWFSPKEPFPKLDLPQDKVLVALHYRTGEVYDKKDWKLRFPLKAPPDQYYIDALNQLLAIEKRPLYIYIFTDSLNPQATKQKFEELFPDHRIEFGCRESSRENAVLEDFFALEQFECLIRPESHFSMAAEYLFSYRIILSPVRFHWINEHAIAVDQIQLEFNAPGQPPLRTTLRN